MAVPRASNLVVSGWLGAPLVSGRPWKRNEPSGAPRPGRAAHRQLDPAPDRYDDHDLVDRQRVGGIPDQAVVVELQDVAPGVSGPHDSVEEDPVHANEAGGGDVANLPVAHRILRKSARVIHDRERQMRECAIGALAPRRHRRGGGEGAGKERGGDYSSSSAAHTSRLRASAASRPSSRSALVTCLITESVSLPADLGFVVSLRAAQIM